MFGLSQHVNVSTHVSGHTLDVIITRSSDNLIAGPVVTTLMLSHHLFVECLVHFPSPSLSKKTVSLPKLKDINIDVFKSDFSSSILWSNTCSWDFNDLVKHYSSTLTAILDKHAPLKMKTLVTRVKIPWFNAAVLDLKCVRCKLESKALIWIWIFVYPRILE